MGVGERNGDSFPNPYVHVSKASKAKKAERNRACLWAYRKQIQVMYRSNRSFNIPTPAPPPPQHTSGIWHLCHPGEDGIWLSESSRGWGIWSLCVRGGEFELHPWFRVKSLASRAIIEDGVLEDFCGKDHAFVHMANWLRGKGLNKLCAIFEGI